jgi:hypothetical protein
MPSISQNSIHSYHIYLGVQITCHATLQPTGTEGDCRGGGGGGGGGDHKQHV